MTSKTTRNAPTPASHVRRLRGLAGGGAPCEPAVSISFVCIFNSSLRANSFRPLVTRVGVRRMQGPRACTRPVRLHAHERFEYQRNPSLARRDKGRCGADVGAL